MELFKYFGVIILLSFTVVSCQIDEYDVQHVDVETHFPDTVIVNDLLSRIKPQGATQEVSLGCFNIILPFTVLAENGFTYAINQVADWNIIVQSPEVNIIDFVYPIQVENSFYERSTIEDLSALALLFSSCIPNQDIYFHDKFPAYNINPENSCFSLVFPITLESSTGEIITVQNQKVFSEILPSDDYYFVFPIELRDLTGNIVRIDHDEELYYFLISCNESTFIDSTFYSSFNTSGIGCYQYIFPLQVRILGNNQPVNILDEYSLNEVIMTGKFVNYVYPIFLKDHTGDIIEVEDELAWEAVLASCYFEPTFLYLLFGSSYFLPEPCYDFIFPVRALHPMGDTLTFYSDLQIEEASQDSAFFLFQTVFPVDIRLIQSQQNIRLLKLEDLFDVLNRCG